MSIFCLADITTISPIKLILIMTARKFSPEIRFMYFFIGLVASVSCMYMFNPSLVFASTELVQSHNTIREQTQQLVSPNVNHEFPQTTIKVGEVFTVNVLISNVTNLGAFEATTLFPSNLVTVEQITVGAFLGSTGRTIISLPSAINHNTGSAVYAFTSLGVSNGPNGSGTIAQIRMRAHHQGYGALTFETTQGSTIQGDVITLQYSNTPFLIKSNLNQVFIPNTRRNTIGIW